MRTSLKLLLGSLAAFLFASLLGCSDPRPLPVPEVVAEVTAAELYASFDRQLPGLHFASDERYAVPDSLWVSRDFLRAWHARLPARPLFRREANDCDDFVRSALAFARDAHAAGSSLGALACGEVWYTDRTRGRHAVALFVVQLEPGSLGWVAVECTDATVKEMDEAERDSVELRLF